MLGSKGFCSQLISVAGSVAIFRVVRRGRGMRMNWKNMIRAGIAVAVSGLLLSGMNAVISGAKTKKVSSVKIKNSGKYLLINKKEKKKLSVKFKPGKGINKKLKWTSSRKKVVSVSQKGVIRGKKYGKATITARAKDGSGKYAKLRVRVGKKVNQVNMQGSAMDLDVGSSASLGTRVSPSQATIKKVKYHTSNKSTATVSKTGIVYGKSKGTATITAYSTDGSGKKASCRVNVRVPSQSVRLNAQDTIRLEVGKTVTINATVQPANASNRNVRYTSSDPAVAKVSQMGVVTGVDSGTATIRVDAADGRASAAVEVEVYKVELQNEKLIAHRGYSSEAPENTTVAFELAVQNGFYGVECDLRKTFDGSFVIMHDADLNRMCGYNLDISSLDLQQLKNFKITGGRNISLYPDLTVPTLEEYLDILADSSTVHPFIELKVEYTEKELEEIVSQVKEKGLLERTYFISVHKSNLLALKKMEGVYKEGLQYVYGAESDNKLTPVSSSVINWCIENQIDLDARHTLLSASDVSLLHDSGRQVNVWTVNSVERACELVKDFNVDMVTTEYMLKS